MGKASGTRALPCRSRL